MLNICDKIINIIYAIPFSILITIGQELKIFPYLAARYTLNKYDIILTEEILTEYINKEKSGIEENLNLS